MGEEAAIESNVEVNQEVNAQPEAQPKSESKPIVRICSHIKGDGIRCGTPALHGRQFCYFHQRAHHPGARLATRRYRAPIPDSVASLQIAMAHAMQALMSGDLTPKQANSIMYGINLSTNLLRLSKPLSESERQQVVTDIPEAMEVVLVEPSDPGVEAPNQSAPPAPSVPPEAILVAQNQIKELRNRMLPLDYYKCFQEMMRTQKGIDDQKYNVAVNRIYEHDYAVAELKKLGVAV